MPTKPLRLQLAIQGGGAKICALLAAASCVEELVSQGRIEITRIAGTSAGAIVACLLAAGISIGEVRQRLQDLGSTGLRRLFPARWRIPMYGRFLRGVPLWDTEPLRELLAEFFDRRGIATLEDIRNRTGRHVFITAADITNERRLDYRDDNDPIVSSLISSCSLPYVFSTYKNCGPNAIVDGGICENLPIDLLKEEEGRWGQVIGISLVNSRPRTPPSTLRDFSLALMNTSINNSMMRAKESIGSKRVFRIVTDIDTLEFDRALDEGLGVNHFGRIKLEAEKFFATLDMVRQPEGDQGLLVGDPWRGDNIETMKRMGRIYLSQHETAKLDYACISLVIHANCLFPEGHPQHGLPDLIEQKIVFRPHSQPIYCHRLTVGSSTATDFPGRLSCSVRNVHGREHLSEVVPSLTEDPTATGQVGSRIKREILLFFTPPLAAGEDVEAPYTISMRDCLRGAMSDLYEKGEDFMQVTVLRTASPAERVDLVLLVPEDYPQIAMLSFNEGSDVGRAMNNAELSGYYVPHSFRALGWTGRNVPPGASMKVKFVPLPTG